MIQFTEKVWLYTDKLKEMDEFGELSQASKIWRFDEHQIFMKSRPSFS